MDRAGTPESNNCIAANQTLRPLRERSVLGELQPRRADDSLGRPSRIMGLTRSLGVIAILAVLSAPVQALSAIVPPTQSVTLAWDLSIDPTVVGYKIYYGVASRTYTSMVDVGNATSVTISGLVEGTTYFFAATAYNTLGLESDYSDELSYTVPGVLPTVRIRVTPDGQVVLTVIGQIGHTYDIQTTQTFTAWTVIDTVTVGAGGSLEFIDPNAANFPARFYRTRDTQP